MNEYHLTLPVKEEDIRQLKMGDVVYISGLVHTLRDMGHRRAVELCDQKGIDAIPFQSIINGGLWHCGPIVKYIEDKSKWIVTSAGSTTSSRFSLLGARLINHLKIRVTIGKGTMTETAHKAMKETGSCYLNSTGGCAAMYAEQIESVENVYWKDIGLPEACWVLKVNKLGPLIVGVDSHGTSLFDEAAREMRKNLNEEYAKYGLAGKYAYLPKRVPSGLLEN